MNTNYSISKMEVMYVLKRDGTREEISFDKVLNRIKTISTISRSFSRTLNINPTKYLKKYVDRYIITFLLFV